MLVETEQTLALDVTPASWPIGMGRDFLGADDLFGDALLLFWRSVHDRVAESKQFYSRRVAVAVAQPLLITWSEVLNTWVVAVSVYS